jgi:hypothetical protein
MAGEFKITFNREAEKKLLAAGPLALNRTAEALVREVVKRSPFKTGTNRRSVQSDAPKPNVRRVFTTSGYGALLELGTGVFGPLGKRIIPTKKRALWWPGARHPVASVAGRRPTPYFKPAFDAVMGQVDQILGKVRRETSG